MSRYPIYRGFELIRGRDGTWEARFEGEKVPCITGEDSIQDLRNAVDEFYVETRKRILQTPDEGAA